MTQIHAQVVEEINAVFDGAVGAGMRRDGARGATDEQIASLMRRQGVDAIPHAVRRVWELVGGDAGPFWRGSTCDVVGLSSAAKPLALTVLGAGRGGCAGLADPAGMLVLLEHGGYQFEVVDGADLHLPNPPVWLVLEGGEPLDCRWSSVTSWFRCAGRGVARSKIRFDEHVRCGGSDAAGTRYFQTPTLEEFRDGPTAELRDGRRRSD